MNQANLFQLVTPRSTIEIHLPDGRVLDGPRDAEIGLFLNSLPEAKNPPIVGAIVNGELRELTYKIHMDARVTPITMGDADGMRIYRRSLVFLLETAFEELFSGKILRVDHSVASGGYFCQVINSHHLSVAELSKLQARMQQIVAQDLLLLGKKFPCRKRSPTSKNKARMRKLVCWLIVKKIT